MSIERRVNTTRTSGETFSRCGWAIESIARMISETSGTGGYTTSTRIAKSRAKCARGGPCFIYNRPLARARAQRERAHEGSLVIFFPLFSPPNPINATSRRARKAKRSKTPRQLTHRPLQRPYLPRCEPPRVRLVTKRARSSRKWIRAKHKKIRRTCNSLFEACALFYFSVYRMRLHFATTYKIARRRRRSMSSEIPEGKMKKERAKEKCTRTRRKFYSANYKKNTYPFAILIKQVLN